MSGTSNDDWGAGSRPHVELTEYELDLAHTLAVIPGDRADAIAHTARLLRIRGITPRPRSGGGWGGGG